MQKFKQVIIIDDDFANNLICENVILGFNLSESVKSFLTIEEGLAYLQKVKNTEDFPELIFLDINFPEGDGWSFLEEFRKLNLNSKKSLKLYVLTSSISNKDIDKAKIHPEVQGFISKPLSKEKLAKHFAKN